MIKEKVTDIDPIKKIKIVNTWNTYACDSEGKRIPELKYLFKAIFRIKIDYKS